MTVTIHQPQYLPWLGYFDKADRADVFIILDNVQYKKNDWQNRNRIRTPQGWQWLTVPVISDFGQPINAVKIDNKQNWRKAHWHALQCNYAKAPFFKYYAGEIENIYETEWTYLADINTAFIKMIIAWLGIETRLLLSSEYDATEESTQRLVDLCRHLNADTYLSGADGEKYLDFQKFADAGIAVDVQNYVHPAYRQLWGKENEDFLSHMSVLDLLFNEGPDSLKILRHQEPV